MTAVATRSDKCLYEFDGFRVDPVRRRLLRDGETVPITPKAFSILLILIESWGEVVEKDEIIQKVWPDTFVTEANLTQNVSSLRKALGERANDARYIVTVPGRGYTFVAEVVERQRDATGEISLAFLSQALEVLPEYPEASRPAVPPSPPPQGEAAPRPAPEAGPAPAAGQKPDQRPEVLAPVPEHLVRYRVIDPLDTVQIAPSLRQQEAAVLSSRGAREGFRPRLRIPSQVGLWLAGGLAFLAVAVLAVMLSRERATPGARPAADPAGGETADGTLPTVIRPSVAVLGIRDLSGEQKQAWLAQGFAEMLTSELATSPNVRVVSGEAVAQARRSLSLSDPDALGSKEREHLHAVLGVDFVVLGSYLSVGDQGGGGGRLRIDLRVIKLPGGEGVAAFSEEGTKDQLFELVSRTGQRLRRQMGWAALSPEEAAAARSLRIANSEAARLYSEGLARLRAFDALGARDLLERAAEADPGSPLIRAALAQAWMDLGITRRAAEIADEALKLGAALPQQESLLIQARAREARNDWKKASEIYRTLWTFYPDNLDYGLRLARGLTESGRGKDVAEILTALRKLPPPDSEDPRIDVAEAAALQRLSDFPGAYAAAERAADKGARFEESQIVAQALLLKGDSLLSMSRPQDAVAAYDEARQRFQQAGDLGGESLALTRKGICYHEQGNVAEAEANYRESLEIAENLGHDRLIAIQFGNLGLFQQDLGNLKTSREMLEQSRGRFREAGDRVLENRSLVFLGRVLISQGDLAGAREAFEEALAASRETGTRIDEARSLDQLGVVLARQGALAEARRHEEQALEIARALNDPNRTAAIQASLAWTLAHLGDLDAARRLLDDALRAKRRIDDPLGISVILDQQGEIALQRGDLAAAHRLAQEQLQITEQSRASLLAAAARHNLARYEMAMGNLAAARKLFQAGLAVTTAAGEQIDTARLRLGLAQLELADGKAAAAAEQARRAAGDCAGNGMVGCQAEGLALLAQALAAQGRGAEARRTGEEARQLALRTGDQWTQYLVTTAAETLAGGGSPGEVRRAIGHLRGTSEEARQLGLVTSDLEARLALGIVQASGGDPAGGRAELRKVEEEARRRGLRLLARRAAEAAGSTRPLRVPAPPNLG